MVEDAVASAIELDAACVVVNLLLLPGEDELYRACVRNVASLCATCHPLGMPVMVEPLAMKPQMGAYGVDGDVEKILPLVRQAAELGADLLKADPTDDLDEYGRVLEAAGGRPVLVRGGGWAPDEEILRRTEGVMRLGAAGIVYGRNVVQHESPASSTASRHGLPRASRRRLDRGAVRRRLAPPARGDLRRRPAGRQAPPRREALRDRPGRERGDHARG